MNTFLNLFTANATRLNFAYPVALLAAPVIAILFLIRRRTPSAVSVASTDLYAGIPASLKLRMRAIVLPILATVAVCGFTIAAARPQKINALPDVKKRRNLVLALDLSRSMSIVDFDSGLGRVSRIAAVKSVVKKFIDARPDDRIGIVVFGSQAFVQAPLTLDHAVLQEILAGIRIGTAGDATAIGDGLGVSLKRLKDVPPETAAIILLTDGVSNSGQLEPLTVAGIAKNAKIKIHTIGIGSSNNIDGNGFGGADSDDEFDEVTLKKIADTTGGVYFNARNLAGLEQVYAQIDALERSEKQDPSVEIIDEHYAPFAVAALIAYALYLVAARWTFLKVP